MLSYQKWGAGLLTLLLAVMTYWSGIAEAIHRWNSQEEYSHGFLIPLVSLYILWEKKDLIRASIGQPLWSGLIVIVISTLVYIVGELSALYVLVQYAFVLTLIGISMVFLGKATRHTLAPILLLLFAIPLPYVVEVVLTAKLQLLSSWLGVQLIRFCQIPVFLEGNVIDLGVYQLQVVEACSGLRYLFPLMSLGFIAGYFYQAAFWKRAVVFLATIPITILMNSFRIGMIGVLVDNWGISQAEGFLHDFEGWIIFMACAGLLAVLIWVIERLTSKKTLAQVFGVAETMPSPTVTAATNNYRLYSYTVVVILLLGTALLMTRFIDNRVELIPQHRPFVNFPLQIGQWHGKHQTLNERVENKLAMTDYLLVNYLSHDNELVNFYVAYYESQRKGESPHSPRVCIPGGGWEIASFARKQVAGHPVNRVVIKKGSQQQLVYYWFQGHGRIIANEYINKWYLLQDSIIKNRTDGSLVRLVTPVSDFEHLEDADARLVRFMSIVEPQLQQYISE